MNERTGERANERTSERTNRLSNEKKEETNMSPSVCQNKKNVTDKEQLVPVWLRQERVVLVGLGLPTFDQER